MLLCLLLLACLESPWAAAPGALLTTPAAASELPSGPIPASDPWTLSEAAARVHLRWPPPDVRLTLDKPARALTVWSGGTALKRYRVGLGDPVGDKERQGDARTPEGTLHVVTRNKNSQFHRFLGLDYPTAEDANRGRAAGMISPAQAETIREAARAGRAPDWNTALGGAVGIHGGGSSLDWTLGCIAVENAEIDELWEVVGIGTPLAVSGIAARPLP